MIYLWHNTNMGMYEMGDFTEKTIRSSSNDITIIHEFESDEIRCAEKILMNLNRASGELRRSMAVA